MQNHSNRWAEIEAPFKAPEWPLFMGRQRSRAPEELHKRLDHLFAVKNESAEHPDKYRLSKYTLGAAGLLIGPLIEWAVNHQAGLVIDDMEVPWRSRPRKPITKGKKQDDDAERAGAQYDYGNHVANRRILAALIDGLGSALPRGAWVLVQGAVDAFEALDAGQTMDIFSPSTTHRDEHAWAQDQAKLKALEYLACWRGTGMKPGVAQRDVLEKFGYGDGEPLSPNTF